MKVNSLTLCHLLLDKIGTGETDCQSQVLSLVSTRGLWVQVLSTYAKCLWPEGSDPQHTLLSMVNHIRSKVRGFFLFTVVQGGRRPPDCPFMCLCPGFKNTPPLLPVFVSVFSLMLFLPLNSPYALLVWNFFLLLCYAD